ncbi:hypothetical protein ACM5Q9_13945 [Advenella sp. RU8]|uniref:hypothetical protein n=1 Tax=Advenella sp. RU8 TaxID=3399575 RepID=UPI003AACB9C4
MNNKDLNVDDIPEEYQRIEVHLHDLNKVFDSMDPSPLLSKDLHARVVDHIVDSARGFSFRAPLALILYVDETESDLSNDQQVRDAIRAYFARLSLQARHRLRLHLRRGVISLIIGLAVLFAALFGSRLLGDDTISSTLRESMDIGGWVALWRPMEMFLYDWWPIMGEQILYKRLSRMPIQIQYAQAMS